MLEMSSPGTCSSCGLADGEHFLVDPGNAHQETAREAKVHELRKAEGRKALPSTGIDGMPLDYMSRGAKR